MNPKARGTHFMLDADQESGLQSGGMLALLIDAVRHNGGRFGGF